MEGVRLPKDIEIDILTRLPVKHIMRCKSVCKSWYDLVRSSYFTDVHLNRTVISPRHKSNSCLVTRYHDRYCASLLCSDTFNVTGDIDLNANMLEHLNVAGSCNGLVCICDNATANFFVLNPATRELKHLPPPPPPLSTYPPNYHTASIALGFDHTSDDYKVVRIIDMWNVYDTQPIPLPVQIYSLRGKKWRNTNLVAPALVAPSNHNAYTDGVYYWLGYTREISNLIISFDMVKEEFRTTMLPDFLTRDKHCLELVLWKGTLAIIKYPYYNSIRERQSLCFEMWVMTKPCQEWTKQAAFGPIIGIEKPLAVCEDEETLILESNSKKDVGEVVSYDIKTQQIKHLQIYGRPLMFQVAFYKESLVSVD